MGKKRDEPGLANEKDLFYLDFSSRFFLAATTQHTVDKLKCAETTER